MAHAELQVVHAVVTSASVPQPGKPPQFPLENLTQFYGRLSKYGFDQFQMLPSGAVMSAGAVRQVVLNLADTTIVESLELSGSALRPFAELAETVLDQALETLGIGGFQAARIKLIAYWEVPSGDATTFLARALRQPAGDKALATLGPRFVVAGLRFNNGVPGGAEEWNVRVEPLLRKRDHLWLEVEPRYTRSFPKAAEVTKLVLDAERYLREQLVNAILTLEGDK
jgi:hypothetical protein